MCLSAGVRAWNLWVVPSPTDELEGVRRGLAIARGEILPLTDFEPYIGALWNYLLALGFLISGPSEYVARGVTLMVGVATVPATYLLARELGGRGVAAIAALLLACSSAHALAASHPAWSHSMAPLFLTLGLWQVARCIRLTSGPALLAAGAALGLALQIHLTMLAALPGIGLALLLSRWRWITTGWFYLAALLGLCLIANIIAFNVATGFESVRRAGTVQAAYARAKGPTDGLILDNARRMGVSALRSISGAVDIRPTPFDYTTDPLTLAAAALSASGLLLLTLRGQLLPLFAVSSYIGLLLLFNAKYEVIPNSRFLTPLLPLAFTCTAIALGAGVSPLRKSGVLRSVLISVVALTLAGFSLLGLARRMDQMSYSSRVTQEIHQSIDFVEARLDQAPMVLLDRNLDRLWLDGGGEMYMALGWELYRRNIPYADLPYRVVPRTGDTDPCRRQWLIATLVDRSNDFPRWIRSALGQNPHVLPQRFWTFRVTPQEPRPGNLDENEHVVLAYQPPLNGSSRTVDRCSPGRMI
ncbi:MAG: ArnT family glycosyltransferase [Chloroflexota bacterium]